MCIKHLKEKDLNNLLNTIKQLKDESAYRMEKWVQRDKEIKQLKEFREEDAKIKSELRQRIGELLNE